MFLSQMEADAFSLLPGNTTRRNFTKEEWLAIRGLAEDLSIAKKPADKGFCVVVWGRADYLLEAEKHLNDSSTYKEVKFGDNKLLKLVEESNKMFRRLLSKKCLSPEESRVLFIWFQNSTNLGKLYFLPKIHKRPVISNCGTPAEKMSEYLDYHLEPIMHSAKSYIRDTSNFLKILKELGSVPQTALLVTADVEGLCPSIPHQDGLKALSIRLNQQNSWNKK